MPENKIPKLYFTAPNNILDPLFVPANNPIPQVQTPEATRPVSQAYESKDHVLGSSYSGSDYDIFIHFPDSSRSPEGTTLAPLYNLIGATQVNVNTYTEMVAKRPLGFRSVKEYGVGSRTVAGQLAAVTLRTSFIRAMAMGTNSKTSIGDINFAVDSIPPFNIIIVATNSKGDISYSIIFGAKLITTSMGIGVFDKYTEESYDFVAKDWLPLTNIPYNEINKAPEFIQPVLPYVGKEK